MNISEASAVNTVLDQLLATSEPGRPRPSEEQLEQACVLLAHNAHRALGAGVDAPSVASASAAGQLARRPRRRRADGITPARG